MPPDEDLSQHPAVQRRYVVLIATTILQIVIFAGVMVIMPLLSPDHHLGLIVTFSISTPVLFGAILAYWEWYLPRRPQRKRYHDLADEAEPFDSEPEWVSRSAGLLAKSIRRLGCRLPKFGLVGSADDKNAKPPAWLDPTSSGIYIHRALAVRQPAAAVFVACHELGHWVFTVETLALYRFNRVLCYMASSATISAWCSVAIYCFYYARHGIVDADYLFLLFLASLPLLILAVVTPFLHSWFMHADEYMADAIGAELFGDKEVAMAALATICSSADQDGRRYQDNWSYTHPSAAARIRALSKRS